MTIRISRRGILAGSATLLATPTQAQEAPQDRSGDEIVVTALKRETNLQDTPVPRRCSPRPPSGRNPSTGTASSWR